MIIKRTLACLSAVSALFIANVSHAEMGPYVGIGGGFTQFDDDGFVKESTGDSDWDDSGTAYRFIAGYKFSENFSIEWTFQDYDYNEYGVDSVSEVDMQAWHVSGVLSYPIPESPFGPMEVFGKLGLGESDYLFSGRVNLGLGDQNNDGNVDTIPYKEQQTNESILLGGGAQFHINEDFRIRTELDITTFGLDVAYGINSDSFTSKDYQFYAVTASASLVYLF
ncbi:outer membrane beta-barrel protein [Litoribacillus peritrichatus]|uniref:Outer membrane protein beta-barrel domain-containing protein n=1 Tax=Litoribacillus peritrichatus TaxID=718191 RepID=A0ABP7ND37_9GAMM